MNRLRTMVYGCLFIAMLSTSATAAQRPPRILYLRPEDGKAVLAFAPTGPRADYRVRVRLADGRVERLVAHVEVTRYAIHGLRNGALYRVSVAGPTGPWSAEQMVRPTEAPSWSWLRQAFAGADPTRNSNPFTMVHGNETEAELRAILRAAHQGGFEGVTIHPYNYADFLGPGQWSRWRILIDEARRLGLCLWQQDDRNYPSGSVDGRITAAHPEFGRWVLAPPVERSVSGPVRLSLSEVVAPGEQLASISAFPASAGPAHRSEPIDLTDTARNGTLRWDPPAGAWRLFVVKAVRDMPRWIDFMNPRAVDAYLAAIYDATYREVGSEFGRTWRGFFTDEAPVHPLQYSADLPARFERAHGYSPRPWLPGLWHDLGPGALRIRSDYRAFVREQNAAVFFGRSRDWCRRHGVSFIGHVIEDHEQDFRRLEFLDMPGFDHIFDQWYRPDPDVYWRQSKMTSSIAHYNRSRADLAMVEHFAATGWRTGLSEMKRMMDWTTAMGLNQVVPCGLDTQDPPVWEDQPEFWLHGKNPQWPHFADYQACANRMTMLMRGGRHIAPVLILDNTESAWVGPADEMWRANAALGKAQLDFDNLPYRVFTDPARTRLVGGQVQVGQERYRTVVLPGVDRVPPAVLRRLLRFRNAGGLVVALGRTPTGSCRGDQDGLVKELVDQVWHTPARRGAALMLPYDRAGAAIRALGAWDVRLDPRHQSEAVLACHRRLGGRDLYFVANTGDTPVETSVELRAVRGTPELWDPVTGAIRPARSARSPYGLRVMLELGEGESTFVVAGPGEPARASRIAPLRPAVTLASVTGSWTEVPGPRPEVRTWQARLDLAAPPPLAATLDLPGACEVISATVNGRVAGTRFCPPYRFAVGRLLHRGSNVVRITQVERWQYLATPPTVDDPALAYTGAWQSDAYTPAWNHTRHYTNQPGAAATYRFTGTGVSWIGERNDDRGTALVYLDGNPAQEVDTANAGPEASQSVLWRATGLANAAHTLRIECTGRKGTPRSRGAYISVDGLAVVGAGPTVPWREAVVKTR